MIPFVVAIAYLTGWLLLWIALKVGVRAQCLFVQASVSKKPASYLYVVSDIPITWSLQSLGDNNDGWLICIPVGTSFFAGEHVEDQT